MLHSEIRSPQFTTRFLEILLRFYSLDSQLPPVRLGVKTLQ